MKRFLCFLIPFAMCIALASAISTDLVPVIAGIGFLSLIIMERDGGFNKV